MAKLLICIFLLLHFSVRTFGQDVFSCGGFIQSPVAINYGNIMVKLYTPEGHLKYETECAPNNGYYMIPVYSKGTYLLKVHPPTGWEFEPESIDLTVDGVNDPCTKGKDINFVFKGFSVVGRVGVKGTKNGQANFNVGLFRNIDDSKEFLSVKTDANGQYVFKGVASGKYFVKNLEKHYCVDSNIVEVIVSENPVVVSAELQVVGYSVTGDLYDGGQPVANAVFFLYRESKPPTPVKNCKEKLPYSIQPPETPALYVYVCPTVTDERGLFEFACVSPGMYTVIPVYKTEDVTFDLSPYSGAFSVFNEPLSMRKNAFVVKGFSVGGTVLMSEKGRGVANAVVKLDGREVGKTDETGSYFLNEVTSGSHKIEAQLENVEFSVVEIQLSPKNSKIPNIVATKFNVCGKVSFHSFPAEVPKLTQRKLILTNERTKDVSSITTDQDGSFCRMVHPGDYSLEPQILPNERQAGFTLIPAIGKFSVSDKPVSNVDFSQFEAKIAGVVKCLDICKKVSITLSNANGKLVTSLNVPLVQPTHNYEFKKLLPGKYIVKIVSENYCWEQNEKTVNVETGDVENVNFLQNGFSVSITSSNDAKLTYTLSSNSIVTANIVLKKGLNTFCFPSQGKYELKLISCHKFDKDIYTYNTAQPIPLILAATKHLVSGTVTSSEPITDIQMFVKSSKVSEAFPIGPLKTSTPVTNETKRFQYNFEYFAENGEQLEFSPKSRAHLYEPETSRIVVNDDCMFDASKFVAHKGLFLDGKIRPSLEGATIVMKNRHHADQQFSTVSAADGTFTIGPLRTFEGFDISAERSGYVFLPVSGKFGHFSVQKLSELTLKAIDLDGNALAGVLLSLSGQNNYRSNNITEENGFITFVGLSPGEYYVKPIFKEYSFEPSTKIVQIQEGSTVTVDLIGKRVAFSCFGHVRHLASQPVPSIGVEAYSSGCNQLHEESVTAEDGSYKIRGLQPGCEYVLQIKPGQKLPSTIPKKHVVKVVNEDIMGKDLILKPEINTMDLTGRVDCDRALLSNLKVVLYKEDSTDSALHTVHFHTASVFFLPSVPIDNSGYIARLESSLNPNEYLIGQLPEIYFKANHTFQFLHFEFKPKKKPTEAEILRGGYIALPITVIAMLLAYNYDKVLPVFQDWLQIAMATIGKSASNLRSPPVGGATDVSAVGGDADAGDSNLDAQGVGGKKKTRARKT